MKYDVGHAVPSSVRHGVQGVWDAGCAEWGAGRVGRGVCRMGRRACGAQHSPRQWATAHQVVHLVRVEEFTERPDQLHALLAPALDVHQHQEGRHKLRDHLGLSHDAHTDLTGVNRGVTNSRIIWDRHTQQLSTAQ